MTTLGANNLPSPDQQRLCNNCQNISFDRLVEEETIKHSVFKEVLQNSSHCVLCRLIVQTIRKSIVDSSPEGDVESYVATVGPCEISLVFSMSAEYNERLYIAVGPPSLMIDGWLPFSESGNSLRLFCQPGERHEFLSLTRFKCR